MSGTDVDSAKVLAAMEAALRRGGGITLGLCGDSQIEFRTFAVDSEGRVFTSIDADLTTSILEALKKSEVRRERA